MRAVDAPSFGDPTWNHFRRDVAEAITDVQVEMQQRQKGLDSQGLTLEVAARLQLELLNQEDFDVLAALVRSLRPLATESLRATREDHSGQFALLLT